MIYTKGASGSVTNTVSKLRKWVARAILLVLFTAGMLFLPVRRWVESISWFHIKTIIVSAEAPLTEDEIRRSLPITDRTSLITLDAESIVLRLKSLIWVDQAVVKKEFPNRLFVKATPRIVSAIWIRDGEPHYLDAKGILIERIDRRPLSSQRLPVISQEAGAADSPWSKADILETVHRIQRSLEPDFLVSELNLDRYPYFRIFLTPLPVEVLFDFETWSSQLPYLVMLLRHPPLQTVQPKKINLIFPKKTIVTTQENK